MTARNHLVPTSSRPRPNRGDDLPDVTSSLVPHPVGDEVTLRRPGHTTENPQLVPTTTGRPDGLPFHLYVDTDTPLCLRAGDTTIDDVEGHYLTETPDNVDCPLRLAWMHA